MTSAERSREFAHVLDHVGISAMIQSVNYMGESMDGAVMIIADYCQLCVVLKDRVWLSELILVMVRIGRSFL